MKTTYFANNYDVSEQDFVGLAHLLEHTIFQVSELFPTEGFCHFLSNRGGSSNAFKASTCTYFHFDIHKEHFFDALDRYLYPKIL